MRTHSRDPKDHRGSLHQRIAHQSQARDGFLPTCRRDMQRRGWTQLDILIVTGDAYVDHPAFGPVVIARWLESLGYRVGIVAQPRWQHPEDLTDFTCMGAPRLFVGVSAGNLDSMLNKLTAQKKTRSIDEYSPGGEPSQRPNRATIVYANLCRRLFPNVPVVLGGVEASLRRLAHYDYWQDSVRRSVLLDAKADLLVFGMGELAIQQVASKLAVAHEAGQVGQVGQALNSCDVLDTIAGTARTVSLSADVRERLKPGVAAFSAVLPELFARWRQRFPSCKDQLVVLPSFEQVRGDKGAFATMTRLAQQQTNPCNAVPMLQVHGDQGVLLWPPSPPLTTEQLDRIHELPFQRRAHPSYSKPVPALASVHRSITAVRGCFGGCAFCSITEHQGRTIQSRSPASVVREAETLAADRHFDGTIADVGGPSANMYRMGCSDAKLARLCRRYSCLHPKPCRHLNTDHHPLMQLLECVRKVDGVKHVFVNSGIRYDVAALSTPFIRQIAKHHTSGQLSVAPEHCVPQVLHRMRKPAVAYYERFAVAFTQASERAGKQQYLIPYLIVGHPGETLSDTIELALYLKKHNLRPRQIQEFIPTPMTVATCMYYTGLDPLSGEPVAVERDLRRKRAMKALLMWWDPKHWPLAREALRWAKRPDLINVLLTSPAGSLSAPKLARRQVPSASPHKESRFSSTPRRRLR